MTFHSGFAWRQILKSSKVWPWSAGRVLRATAERSTGDPTDPRRPGCPMVGFMESFRGRLASRQRESTLLKMGHKQRELHFGAEDARLERMDPSPR